MISREQAIKTLEDYWGTKKFVFQADFHIPKNIKLREGTRPFGYFRNFRLNGDIIDYPVEYGDKHDRRISVYHPLKKGLEDNQRYEVAVELNNDNYRKKNPFSLIVKSFKKLTESAAISENSILDNTIKQIFKEKIDIGSPFTMVELANSVESLATDIYSENKRFVYELIQNADDAATDDNAELSIDILDNYVVISHNGAPFDSRDLRGLCSIGIGTKSGDASKTGYKGIGFKSVFGQPDGVVYVKTEDTLFRFDRDFASKKGWNTKWGNKEEWEKKERIIFNCPWQMMPILSKNINDVDVKGLLNNNNYSVKTAIKIKDRESLYNDIIGLFDDAKFMLFLRKVKSVHLNSNEHHIHLEKVKHKSLSEVVSLQKNGKLQSNWYVQIWEHNIPPNIQKELKLDLKTPKKIQYMEKTEISFAFKLNKNNDEIQLLKDSESPIYSYLPTSVKEYNFPFIANCNFLLDAGREKIHKNRIWNEWLFQVIGYETIQCCAEFAEKNLFSTSYLSLLRNGLYNETDKLNQKINEGLKIGFNKHAFIRNSKDELCKLHEICLDPYGIAKIDASINKKLAQYLNSTEVEKGLKGQNIIPLSDENKVLKKFKTIVLNEELLQGFFASEHLRSFITKENNFKVLQFIRPYEESDPSGKWYTVVTKNQLIINHDDELDYITGVCFPMQISVENDEKYQNRLIHETVYDEIKNNKELISWLQKLGVTEPGSIAYLEKEIIGNIDSCISEENFLELTKFIYELYASGKLEENHFVNLQELPLKTNQGFKKANQCVLPEEYNPSIDISKVLPNAHILSKDYIQIANPKDCRTFFKLLNVTDDIDFIKSSKKSSSELNSTYVSSSNSFSKDGHAYPHLIGVFHPNLPITNVPYFLQTFSFFDEITSPAIAGLFWDRLFFKFKLKKDKSEEISCSYGKKRQRIHYNIGGAEPLTTLDSMSWGRFPQNRTLTQGYFFWQLDNINCMPTACGMKLPKDSFVNSDYNKALAGDFLPLISLDSSVPEDWRRLLNLKTKFSLEDLLIVLEKISGLVVSKASLNKENEKRIGLVYNELIKRIEASEDGAQDGIRLWSANNRLISTSKKSFIPEELLWIKASGFENISSGIETLFVPNNVDKKSPQFELLLKAFGVKIIEEYSYQADNKKEFYDLKIKLLNLVGPIGLLLKNKLQISDLDKFMFDRFQKISNTKFIKCDNIHPVFNNESENIAGDIVSYCYDKLEEQFLISMSWKQPVSLLNISYDLSRLLSAVRVERELMMLLNMNKGQIIDYLNSLDLVHTEYEACSSYKDILNLIEVLEEKSKPIVEPSNTISESKETKPFKEEKEKEVEMDSEEDLSEEEDGQKGSNEKSNKYEYSQQDLEQIKKLFGRELPDSELKEENLYAQIKALRYFKDNNYDVSGAEADFKDNFDNKYLSPIIDENGDAYKVMCRSARRGILFFGAYAWTQLKDTDTLLYVLTGDTSVDCHLINTQEELEQEFDSHYNVLRRENTTSEKLGVLIEAETELSDLQLLYKVKGSSFDIIFNPQQNEDGSTEGPLTDIGVDI